MIIIISAPHSATQAATCIHIIAILLDIISFFARAMMATRQSNESKSGEMTPRAQMVMPEECSQ